MPYDFIFRRESPIDNILALEKNIVVAGQLTSSFPEVNDPNPLDSKFYFTRTVLDENKEYPDQHFYLEANINGFFYLFSFWKDFLIVELGAGGDIHERFRHLRNYSEIILRQGFQIEDPSGELGIASDIAFSRHIDEYRKWVNFVDEIK